MNVGLSVSWNRVPRENPPVWLGDYITISNADVGYKIWVSAARGDCVTTVKTAIKLIHIGLHDQKEVRQAHYIAHSRCLFLVNFNDDMTVTYLYKNVTTGRISNRTVDALINFRWNIHVDLNITSSSTPLSFLGAFKGFFLPPKKERKKRYTKKRTRLKYPICGLSYVRQAKYLP